MHLIIKTSNRSNWFIVVVEADLCWELFLRGMLDLFNGLADLSFQGRFSCLILDLADGFGEYLLALSVSRGLVHLKALIRVRVGNVAGELWYWHEAWLNWDSRLALVLFEVELCLVQNEGIGNRTTDLLR